MRVLSAYHTKSVLSEDLVYVSYLIGTPIDKQYNGKLQDHLSIYIFNYIFCINCFYLHHKVLSTIVPSKTFKNGTCIVLVSTDV